jgi:plastocyanin
MKTLARLASAAFAAAANASPSVKAATIEIRLQQQNFQPKAISAKPGDTIVFYNDDSELHSVFTPDAKALLAEHFIEPHTKYEVVIPAGAARAEALFDRALMTAREHQAKSWELRAAISMVRLRREQGNDLQGRDLLAPIFDWFSEGFDTYDLKMAKSLLDEMAC